MPEEFAPTESEAPQRGSRLGFWMVAVAFLLAGALLVVAILANRPLVDSIGHGQDTLREALAAAERIRAEGGSFAAADVEALTVLDPDHTYVAADTPSTNLDTVSVVATDGEWAAAVRVNEACFYIRQVPDEETAYGSGTVCTGEQALGAVDSRW
jgi:hypothetical protein